MKKILIAVVGYIISDIAIAHGGGLDSNGCHTKRSTSEYPCHRNGYKQTKQANRNKADPTCHIGSREGCYRIVNGKKRYGC
jgi:hypothetical protein